VFEEIVHDLLFRLLVETSDIEGDKFELLPLRFHFREISFDPRFVFVRECISPVFSVVCSTPTVPMVFVLGLLVPRCYLSFRILGRSSPTITMVFLLGLLFVLLQLQELPLVTFLLCPTGCSWQVRSGFFRSPLLLFCGPMVILGCFFDSFGGVFPECPILFAPCNPFCDSRILVVLA